MSPGIILHAFGCKNEHTEINQDAFSFMNTLKLKPLERVLLHIHHVINTLYVSGNTWCVLTQVASYCSQSRLFNL